MILILMMFLTFSNQCNHQLHTEIDMLANHAYVRCEWQHNEDIYNMLPEDALHPRTVDSCNVYYDGVSGKESYYTTDVSYVVNTAYQYGYDKDEYPYYIREDGCKMFGDYIICTANYPYGSVIDTSLGKAIVLDKFGTSLISDDINCDVELAVNWL